MKSETVMLLAAMPGVAAAQPGAHPAPPPATPAAPAQPTPAAPGGPNPAAPTTSAAPEVLTLERAIEIAMKQQPSLRQSKAQLEAARGRVDLARVARNPTLSVDASAGIGSSRGGNFLSHSESTGLGATANW